MQISVLEEGAGIELRKEFYQLACGDLGLVHHYMALHRQVVDFLGPPGFHERAKELVLYYKGNAIDLNLALNSAVESVAKQLYSRYDSITEALKKEDVECPGKEMIDFEGAAKYIWRQLNWELDSIAGRERAVNVLILSQVFWTTDRIIDIAMSYKGDNAEEVYRQCLTDARRLVTDTGNWLNMTQSIKQLSESLWAYETALNKHKEAAKTELMTTYDMSDPKIAEEVLSASQWNCDAAAKAFKTKLFMQFMVSNEGTGMTTERLRDHLHKHKYHFRSIIQGFAEELSAALGGYDPERIVREFMAQNFAIGKVARDFWELKNAGRLDLAGYIS
jgi:hypothetical protein